MTIIYHIEYRTSWGEEVKVCQIQPCSDQSTDYITLHTIDGIHWFGEAQIQEDKLKDSLQYYYTIWKNGTEIRTEWNSFSRQLSLANYDAKKLIHLYDAWKDIPKDMPLYTSAFTDVLLAHNTRTPLGKTFNKSICIRAYAPQLHANYALAICGNQDALGNWNTSKALIMSDYNFPEWSIEIDASALTYPFEYKFVLYDKQKEQVIDWENNPNRLLAVNTLKHNETVVYSDQYVHFNLPLWKGAGTAIPVFSLRSTQSFGIGDFADIKLMVDWAVQTGQKIVQILPINDTTMTHTWTDSYPYNSISIYALHPMYVNLNLMGKLKDAKLQQKFEEIQQTLNQKPDMDYEGVEHAKWEYIHLLFNQEWENVKTSSDFVTFLQNNITWLRPYAVYCYCRDKYHTANFRDWPAYQTYNEAEILSLCEPGNAQYKAIAIHYFVQYHLNKQLKEAAQYARQRGIIFKGDIPIGISRDSVEAWAEPRYFNLNSQAGAPPDDFAIDGQNWGFPTYNWDEMKKDGYAWWTRRFKKMAEYFDAYRIDHILGFFRIWDIPQESVQGILGQFRPSMPMSVEEIESYGLSFKDIYTKPFIHEDVLQQLFGPYTKEVKQTYLVPDEQPKSYHLLPAFDTQRKIAEHLSSKTDEAKSCIQKGLFKLVNNRLFIADVQQPNTWHPRICAQLDSAYRHLLNEQEKQAFNNLYEHYYYQRHNLFWQQQAMQKLPKLTQATRMLVCGEDLGMIPQCVPWVMNDLRILSLEIQRMPKAYGTEFGLPQHNPYHSVSTISTHDMSTLRSWWRENPAATQRYYNQVLGHFGNAPVDATPEICTEIVHAHLNGNSMFCILSLQDWLSIDGELRNPDIESERINIPSIPRHYWKYRMHLTLEDLLEQTNLNKRIRDLITQSGRYA